MNVKYRYDIPSIETVEDAPHSSDVAVAGGRARQEARALPSQGLAWAASAQPALSAKPGWRFDSCDTISSVLRS